MVAPKGNQFWKLRTKHGRDKLFSNPKILLKEAYNYFQWCDDNPWKVNTAVKAGDHFGEQVSADTTRPYTLSGLCLYLNITQETLNQYGKMKDFSEVVSKIKEICYTQKFEGAAVGAFNANIIARDLRLTDKQEIDISDNKMLQSIIDSLPDETRKQVAESVKEKLKKANK